MVDRDQSARYKRMAGNYEMQRNIESINYKFAIILAIIVIGLLSNGVRSYLDLKGDQRQKRIEFLDKRNEELVQRLRALRERADACETGTPMPRIKD